MPDMVSIPEAVRMAKDALGNVPPHELAAWIDSNLGLTVKPVLVTIMLGTFLEREQNERLRLAARQMVEKARAEQPAGKPKRKAKAAQAGEVVPMACPPSSPALQGTGEANQAQAGPGPIASKGCAACGSEDYVFRGRKQVAPDQGQHGPVMETRHCCRSCGHQWKVRSPA